MVVARKACFKVSWKHFAKTSLQCGQTPRFLFQRSIRYEQEFTDTVLDFIKLLNQGDVVFEIGSNIGQVQPAHRFKNRISGQTHMPGTGFR